MRKVVWLLINNIHEKIDSRSATRSKDSCLLCWIFGNSLDNLGKSTRECKTNILRRFQNFWKSSEVFRNLQKKSENVAECSRQPSSILNFFNEIFGSHRNSSDVFRNLWKVSEICHKVLKITFQHFLIFLKIFGNCQKSLEKIGKCWKVLKTIFFLDWRSDSEILICNLHWYYTFCTGITHFALVLLFNCTALSQSESSNFFMYVIMYHTYRVFKTCKYSHKFYVRAKQKKNNVYVPHKNVWNL